MIVPLMIAVPITSQSGRIGMTVAISLFLLVGWYIGHRYPRNGERLIVGGLFVAISQVFPLLHIVSGIVGYTVAHAFGGATIPDDNVMTFITTSELGGFACTLSTGAALVAGAFAIGWLYVAISRLFRSNSNPT
ncbi:MAG: hypothetical protein HKN47_11530 [Pirellulaceae bacterium]|nr:hypothetical protein [Pirellulaceae bacterium]